MATRKVNILITGTPGTGKTTLSEQVAESCNLRHINVGQWVAEKALHDGRDETFDCFILNEDKVVDAMEDVMSEGGNVVDFHSVDFFPKRWFDLVLVLTSETSTLYDRLTARKYKEFKVRENVECEIMQVVLNEAYESYDAEIIQTLPSNSVEEMESNLERTVSWVQLQQKQK